MFRLKARGYDDVTGIIQPFLKWKPWKPLYRPRPEGVFDVSAWDLFRNFEYKMWAVQDLTEIDEEFDRILIGGARILTKDEISKRPIVNVHAGYLPYARGLDALKWAIYHDWAIGVTSHYIDEEIDLGTIIEQRHTPLYPTDSFHSIAMRHYELEIEMMIDSLAYGGTVTKCKKEITDAAGLWCPAPVFRRMPHDKELVMIKRLERRLERLYD